jgi:hypothetical protein
MSHRLLAVTLFRVLLVFPALAQAQDDPPTVVGGLVERLCSVGRDDEADVAACLIVVSDILDGQAILPSLDVANEMDLQVLLDQAIAQLQEVDLRAALDEAVAATQDVDVQFAIAEALAAGEADLQGALGALLTKVDEALPGARDADVDALLADGVTTARAVVAEAEAWVTENAELVCAGSSVGAGVGAAAVVAFLTGSPGLAISAFDRTEQVSRDLCHDVALPDSSPAASEIAG